MLTVTAVLANEEFAKKIESDTQFNAWFCRAGDWDDVREIHVPDMSQKERAFVNKRIARKSNVDIHAEMPFRFETKDADSLALLDSYVQHYRRYPAFGRVYV